MMQEPNDLLLKDLCARLPYGVICKDDYAKVEGKLVQIGINYDMCLLSDDYGKTELAYIPNCKPYLFPMSSMTEEQKKEISKRYNYYNPYQSCVLITDHRQGSWDNDDNSCNLQDYLWLIDWFNKNHFDYRNLIEKGLAIDVTNKNIY